MEAHKIRMRRGTGSHSSKPRIQNGNGCERVTRVEHESESWRREWEGVL